MRYLRGPTVPAVLLAFLTGVGLLLPEVGHSLAHYHAADHHSGPHSAPHHHDSTSLELIGEHHGGDHPHLDLLATPSAKTSLVHTAIVQVCVLALDAADQESALPPPTAVAPPLAGRGHGPPPPSRAPPLV